MSGPSPQDTCCWTLLPTHGSVCSRSHLQAVLLPSPRLLPVPVPSRPVRGSCQGAAGPAWPRWPLPVHGQLASWRVCLGVLAPALPAVYSSGFFSLTSIAYRRVIRVCQYEVGDDLSGRFLSSYSSSASLWFYQCTLDFPRRLCFLTNPPPSAAWDGGVRPPPTAPAPSLLPGPGGVLFPGGRGVTESDLLG